MGLDSLLITCSDSSRCWVIVLNCYTVHARSSYCLRPSLRLFFWSLRIESRDSQGGSSASWSQCVISVILLIFWFFHICFLPSHVPSGFWRGPPAFLRLPWPEFLLWRLVASPLILCYRSSRSGDLPLRLTWWFLKVHAILSCSNRCWEG